MRALEPGELRELLIKGWMTHDAMWFMHTLAEHGIQTANRINLAAVRSMAAVEARRLKKALGLGDIRSMENLLQFLDGAGRIIQADFMRFQRSQPSADTLRWEMPGCFAFDGVSKLGVADAYECGIFPRMEAWFETLGIPYEAAPPLKGCLMHQQGTCARDYRFRLP